MATAPALLQLDTLQSALHALAQAHIGAAEFSRLAEQQRDLLAALPARYAEVMQGLLTRLESSALFTDESCSFSHRDLVDSLQLWLEKARAMLQPSAPAG